MKKNELSKKLVKNSINLCIAFTSATLGYIIISYFSPANFPPLTTQLALELFTNCFAVIVTQFLISLIPLSDIAQIILYFIDMNLVTFVLGYFVFDYFSSNPMNFIFIPLLLLVIFASVYFLSYYEDYRAIKKINEIIKNHRGKQIDEKCSESEIDTKDAI